MLNFGWEDPFGEDKRANRPPPLWMPEQRIPPVSLSDIRERQRPLLSHLEDLWAATDEVLTRLRGRPGGALLIKAVETNIAVRVLYRVPGYPGILRQFGPIHITATPVAFPADKKPEISVFDSLLPIQTVWKAAPDQDDKKKEAIAAVEDFGFIKRGGISSYEDLPPERIVVHPQMLEFMWHWIHNLDSPITDLRYAEVPEETVLRSGTSYHATLRPSIRMSMN